MKYYVVHESVIAVGRRFAPFSSEEGAVSAAASINAGGENYLGWLNWEDLFYADSWAIVEVPE